MHAPTRRRILQIGASLLGLGLGSSAQPATRLRWTGSALGAVASIDLAHTEPERARQLVGLAVAEIERLEAIFSLQRAGSALSMLNRDGRLARPPAELVAVLEVAAAMSRLSGGAFDVTVQPLWRLHAEAASARVAPAVRDVDQALAKVGWAHIDVSRQSIAFRRQGMAVTLNGIAQGYITDRITELLHDAGLENILVDLGEQRAVAGNPEGGPWRLQTSLGRIGLTDRSLAVSQAKSSSYPRDAGWPNLICPIDGRPLMDGRIVAVTAPSAVLADAASTALAVTSPALAGRLVLELQKLGIAYLAYSKRSTVGT